IAPAQKSRSGEHSGTLAATLAPPHRPASTGKQVPLPWRLFPLAKMTQGSKRSRTGNSDQCLSFQGEKELGDYAGTE
ncbi:MAG: hypothetical protein EA401_01370, partial [Planctomycetota bacterium]